MASMARDKGIRDVYVSLADAPEAAPVDGMHVFPWAPWPNWSTTCGAMS